MTWSTSCLLVNVASIALRGTVHAFIAPPSSLLNAATLSSPNLATPGIKHSTFTPSSSKIILSNSNANVDDDDEAPSILEDIESLDLELAREVDEALSLAKNALTVEGEGAKVTVLKKRRANRPKAVDDADVSDSSNEEPEKVEDSNGTSLESTPLPAPPSEDPPSSLFSQTTSIGMEDVVNDDANSTNGPRPPESPPSAKSVNFGETLQKAVVDEMDRLKNLLFGLNQDLEETKSRAEEAEQAAEKLRLDIEASKKEREDTVKKIEEEFAAEKELLATQIGETSEKLEQIIAESEKNITQIQMESGLIEKELLQQIDSFYNSIDQAAEKAKQFNMEKETLLREKESRINQVIEETKSNFFRYKASLDEEGENIKQHNAELERRAIGAEDKVKAVYQKVQQIRDDRVTLQQKIKEVEENALEEISILERQMAVDNDYFGQYLRDQKTKIDNLISAAKEKYESIIQGERAKRESVEKNFIAELDRKERRGKDTINDIESNAKASLEQLEKKHSKERIAIYQQKIEAVSSERKLMLEELAVEKEKLDAIHTEMESKLAGVRAELAEVQRSFQLELEKRRSMAEEERQSFMDQMDEIRSEITAKINLQQDIAESRKSKYIQEQNEIIAKSEEDCRRAWIELANVNRQLSEAGDKKVDLERSLVKQTEKIELYEMERESFRKSLGLSFKLARQKIGSKTKQLVGKKDS